jgi:ribosomal protein S18 acetylase RimI-like enzyme
MVAPEYRGQGIVAKLGQEMLETYQRLGAMNRC